MIWQKLFFKTFSVHGLFINSRFCLYPSDVGGKDFVTRPGRKNGKKWKHQQHQSKSTLISRHQQSAFWGSILQCLQASAQTPPTPSLWRATFLKHCINRSARRTEDKSNAGSKRYHNLASTCSGPASMKKDIKRNTHPGYPEMCIRLYIQWGKKYITKILPTSSTGSYTSKTAGLM